MSDGQGAGVGAAAGVIASTARRAEAAPLDPGKAAVALIAAADALGQDVKRLRMIDYQHRAGLDRTLPSLPAVLATFTTWKHARLRAALHETSAQG